MIIIETPFKMIKKTGVKLSAIIISLVFTITLISAMDITFFYSDNCPHCQQIKPTIFEYAKLDYKNHWNLYETSNQENYKLFKEYGFEGVPSFLIKTNDNREIKITGANLNKLSCELNEMTTKGCPTYQADMCIKESWFIN